MLLSKLTEALISNMKLTCVFETRPATCYAMEGFTTNKLMISLHTVLDLTDTLSMLQVCLFFARVGSPHVPDP